MTKYAVISNRFDINMTKVICIFDNALQRRVSEGHCTCLYRKMTNSSSIDIDYTEILAKEGKKLAKDATILNCLSKYLVWDFRKGIEETSVHAWYTKTYPKDDLGYRVNALITFKDVLDCLDNYKPLYPLLGIADSIIRERIFTRLAQIEHCTYNEIYKRWKSEE